MEIEREEISRLQVLDRRAILGVTAGRALLRIAVS
jgi:hypothetical protein